MTLAYARPVALRPLRTSSSARSSQYRFPSSWSGIWKYLWVETGRGKRFRKFSIASPNAGSLLCQLPAPWTARSAAPAPRGAPRHSCSRIARSPPGSARPQCGADPPASHRRSPSDRSAQRLCTRSTYPRGSVKSVHHALGTSNGIPYGGTILLVQIWVAKMGCSMNRGR